MRSLQQHFCMGGSHSHRKLLNMTLLATGQEQQHGYSSALQSVVIVVGDRVAVVTAVVVVMLL